jgi:hypothetical protein
LTAPSKFAPLVVKLQVAALLLVLSGPSLHSAIDIRFGGYGLGGQTFMGATAQSPDASSASDFITVFPENFGSLSREVSASSGRSTARATTTIQVLERPADRSRINFTASITASGTTPDDPMALAEAVTRLSIIVWTDKRTYFTWTDTFNGTDPLTYVMLRDGDNASQVVPLNNSAKSAWLEAGKKYEFYFNVRSAINTSAFLSVAITLDEAGPPPPPPPPPPMPLPERGAVIYYGIPQDGWYPNGRPYYLESAIGDWWTAGLTGQPWSGFSTYQPYGYGANGNWTFLNPDHQMGAYAVPPLTNDELWSLMGQVNLVDRPNWINTSNLYSSRPVVFAFSGLMDFVHGLEEPLFLTDIIYSEASAEFSDTNACLIAANFGAGGSWQTSNASQGFLIAIGAGSPVEVGYVVPPMYSEYPGAVVSSFEIPLSGDPVRLERGTHYFGALATYQSFPPLNPYNSYNAPFPYRGGQDGFIIYIKTIDIPAVTNPLPVLTKFEHLTNAFKLQWSDTVTRPVNVQRRASLSSGSWETVRSNVTTKEFIDSSPPSGAAFYRLFVPAD